MQGQRGSGLLAKSLVSKEICSLTRSPEVKEGWLSGSETGCSAAQHMLRQALRFKRPGLAACSPGARLTFADRQLSMRCQKLPVGQRWLLADCTRRAFRFESCPWQRRLSGCHPQRNSPAGIGKSSGRSKIAAAVQMAASWKRCPAGHGRALPITDALQSRPQSPQRGRGMHAISGDLVGNCGCLTSSVSGSPPPDGGAQREWLRSADPRSRTAPRTQNPRRE